MHELSIACNLVEIAAQAAQQAGVKQVNAVHLRLGALSGVVQDALRFSYDIATAGTVLEGSQLVIEELPVVVYCAACGSESALPDLQAFRCGQCGAPAAEIRQGRELEIVSLEIADEQPAYT